MQFVGDKTLDLLDIKKMVGIIGSRKPTPKELSNAFEVGAMFAKKGYTIVSGLALGIDIEAHQGALSVGGSTIALLHTTKNEGCYPKRHIDEYNIIINSPNCGVIHCFDEDNHEPYQPGFSKFQRRLVERSVINAFMCSKIFVVTDGTGPVMGGTRYATHHGMKTYNRDVYRIDSNKKAHLNPACKDGKIGWVPETDLTETALIEEFRKMDVVTHLR